MSAKVEERDGPSLERLWQAADWVDPRATVEGVELFRAHLHGRAFTRHRHDVYAIGVIDAGVNIFAYRGRTEHCLPGQVFLLHPDEAHDGGTEPDKGMAYSEIYLQPARVARALEALRGRPTPLPFAKPVADDPVLAEAVRGAFREPLESLALDTLVLQLAEGLLRGAGPSSLPPLRVDRRAVERGRQLLETRLAVVRSHEVEAVTGLDRYEFARQFRVFCGTSPYRFSLMRRLDAARRRLHEGYPVVQVALSVGFADQAHLTRAFKAAFGMTPGRYSRLSRARPA